MRKPSSGVFGAGDVDENPRDRPTEVRRLQVLLRQFLKYTGADIEPGDPGDVAALVEVEIPWLKPSSSSARRTLSWRRRFHVDVRYLADAADSARPGGAEGPDTHLARLRASADGALQSVASVDDPAPRSRASSLVCQSGARARMAPAAGGHDAGRLRAEPHRPSRPMKGRRRASCAVGRMEALAVTSVGDGGVFQRGSLTRHSSTARPRGDRR